MIPSTWISITTVVVGAGRRHTETRILTRNNSHRWQERIFIYIYISFEAGDLYHKKIVLQLMIRPQYIHTNPVASELGWMGCIKVHGRIS